MTATIELRRVVGDTTYCLHHLGLNLWTVRANGTDLISPTTRTKAEEQFRAVIGE